MSTPSECSSEGFSHPACGFVLEFEDIITTYKMNNYGGYQDREKNSNMNSNNTMFQSSNFRNDQNGPNMNQNNNNFSLQDSNSNMSLAQSQTIPIRNNSRKLHVQLTQDEQNFYSSLYNKLDSNNLGRILGKPAANFMKRSNLQKNVLKEIWLIAAQSSNTYLLREEFYVAMRLIALAQNNMPYNAQSIEMNNPIPPLAQFSFNNPNINNQSNNKQNNQNFNFNNNQNIYEISEEEKSFLKNIFDKTKEPNSERITAHNAIIIWKGNNADDNAIKIVANIIKPLENKGFLNLKEFQVACHLITISKKSELPQKLPDILINYLGRNNNNFSPNDFGNSRMNTNSNLIQFSANNNNKFQGSSKQLSNSPILNNDNNFNNDRIQEILRKEEELTKKNNILDNQINSAKNKINDLLKEIEFIQKRQDNINNELINLRQECNNLRNNGNSNNTNNNINNKNLMSKNSENNLNNPMIKKNLENIGKNMRYDTSDLNSNNELNNNFAPPVNQNQNDGYPNLENKKPDLMDLMDKMDLNINNNNNDRNNNNFNNNDNNFNNNQKNLDFGLEDNLKINNEQAQNPYEMGNNNKNDNKVEDNGSNQRNDEDEWDF